MDLQHLRASDGTGEAVLAHIQTVRNPGSTVLDLDNVDNWNTKAVVITGTPAANGFISPAGMKVMYGHLNAGDFIIDGFAPGYVDNGNTTAEVAIVKMTTSWADALVNILQTSLNDNGTLRGSAVNAPQGFLMNGKIVRTVTSNNITVALKTLAGTDATALNPIYVRIGDTVRAVTAALSVTKNAGTNWCNGGADGLATNEIDYFVYLGYNATDGVTIGFSRIPWALTYSDFSATTTNEKYCAISTITNAVAGDQYEVVGRFNATLSATAAFNWSVPATSIIINRPIYETRFLNFTVTTTNSPYWSALTAGICQYKIVERHCFVKYSVTGTSNSTDCRVKTPMNISDMGSGQNYEGTTGLLVNNSGTWGTPGRVYSDTATNAGILFIVPAAGTASWTASGQKAVRFPAEYSIA